MTSQRLIKAAAKGVVYWQITQDADSTYVEYGQVNGKARQNAPIQHSSVDEARKYTARQIQHKQQQGYRKQRKQLLKRVSEFEDEPAETGGYHRQKQKGSPYRRPLPQHYNGEFDYNNTEGVSSANAQATRSRPPRQLQAEIKRLERKRNRTLEEDILLANARADAKKFGTQMSIDDDEDGDTDSVSSSVSGHGGGISPLKRRRSMRIALMKKDTIEMRLDRRQNSVEMTTPPHLKRLNTQQRWGFWRPKRQATSLRLKPEPQPMNVDEQSPRVLVRRPALMKRVSTTAGLRAALGGTKISEEIIVPKVFENDKDEVDGGAASTSRPSNLRKSMRRLGTKTVQIMPSVLEGVGPEEEPAVINPLSATVMKGATSSTAPRMKRTTSRPRLMKRSSTTAAPTEDPGPSNKRTRRSPLQRSQSISAATREIALPEKGAWPIRIPAQVVWRVPLTIPGMADAGRTVCIQRAWCAVGDSGGRVFVIDENVSVKQILQLPMGIKEIIRDGQFVYAVCCDGHVYDISQADPRLVFDLKSKGKAFALDVYDGVVVAYDTQGHVCRYDHNAEMVWKSVASIGDSNWLHVGDVGVLCCSLVGVTCLSLRDGTQLWETPLRDTAVHAHKHQELLYVACGSNVMRLDTTIGDVTKIYKAPLTRKGKGVESSSLVTHVTVGGGLVFACGENIVCYDEETGGVVYILQPPTLPCRDVKYFEGRLFYVGDAYMCVIDFSPNIIINAQNGTNLEPVNIGPNIQAPIQLPLQSLPTISVQSPELGAGVELECFRPEPRKSPLKVRAKSKGYSGELDVQLPMGSSFKEGSKFLVQDLKRSDTGGFYRVLGDIKQIGL